MKATTKNFNHLLQSYVLILLCIAALLPACGSLTNIKSPDSRTLLLRDEGLSQLSYVDLSNPAKNWYVPVPAGRDLQLVGAGRVLIGTGTGYEEREIANGSKVSALTTFPGTQTARRLRNGNTLLAGANWQGKQGIVLVEADNAGNTRRLMVYPGFSYVRCIRETVKGTFLVTADDIVFEGDDKGNILWRAEVSGPPAKPHIWQALRLANGQTIVSSGYAKNLQIFSEEGKLVSTITAPAEAKPNFFAGFQILNNRNYLVTNWQGHGPEFGSSGLQLLEFSPDGRLVWSWKQNPEKFSSLQGVILLDGLDINKLHVEDVRGMLEPVDAVK